MIAACVPMLLIGITSAAFLSGVEAALPALSWFATHGWTFEASFALCLAVNVLIVVEGIGRYRVNLDADERRRIQIVVFTGVPAVFAYALEDRHSAGAGIAGPADRAAVADRSVPAGDRPAAGVRAALRGRGAPRLQPAHGAAPRPAVRVRAPHACRARRAAGDRARRLARAAARSVAGDDRERPAAVLSVLPGAARPRLEVSRAGAAVARQTVLPRRIRRARNPGVAGRPRAVRSRPARPGRDGRDADRFGAASGKHRGAGIGRADGVESRRQVRAGVDVARRRHAAAGRQRHHHAAALVRQAARGVPGR